MNDDGRFSMTLASGQYAVWVQADGYTRGSQAVTLAADLNIDFYLEPEAQLVGKVIDKQTRQPIPGVEVRAFPAQQLGRHHPAVRSDLRGEFVIPELEAGRWVVEARLGPLVGHASAAEVVQAQATRGLVVEMYMAPSVSGRVITTDGRALPPKVKVMAALLDSRLASHVLVDEAGLFRLQGVEPGRYEVSAATSDGFRGFLTIDVADRDINDLEMLLVPPIAVQGRVTDSTGRALGGVRVLLQTVATEKVAWSRKRMEITKPDGTFRVVGLPHGDLMVKAELEGYEAAEVGPSPLEPGAGHSVELQLASREGSMSRSDQFLPN